MLIVTIGVYGYLSGLAWVIVQCYRKSLISFEYSGIWVSSKAGSHGPIYDTTQR